MHLPDLIPALIEIVTAASDKILAIYKDETKFHQVEAKADNSPLTLADQAAHLSIVKGLSALTPGIPILSEEGKEIAIEERKKWTSFWLVDPLDGTKEFIKRNGEFTVNIALIEEGKPVVGIVHIPVSNETYYAYKGGGAFKKVGHSAAFPIHAASFRRTDTELRIVCSRSHLSKEVTAYVSQFDRPEKLSMGSSLKFMLIAEGKADIYPRLAPTMEWDTGAAHIIVEEAGGKVLKHEVNEPLTYNKDHLLNPYFIAFGREET